MPVTNCQEDSKHGFRWGKSGKCFVYQKNNKESIEEARKKALEQGRAIEANKESIENICLGS